MHALTPAPAYPLVPATVPDDGDDENAASVNVAFQAHENSIATLTARLGGPVSGLATEWSYPSAKGRATRIPAVGGVALDVYVPPAGAATPVTRPWKPYYGVNAGGGPGGRDIVTPAGNVRTGNTFHTYVRPVSKMIMPGGTIASVEVRVYKGSAQATSTDRVKFYFYKVDLLSVRTDLYIGVANASGGDETIFATGASEVVDLATQMYYLDIVSSAGAGIGTEDYFSGANINWTDPGPRN